MARKTPTLELNPETRQVVAQDLNLFYRPEVAPQSQGVEEFTRSLDSWVNNAGTKLALAGEVKEKKVNEAQAIKEYNENRGQFNELVRNGSLPKEANPYFIDKYKGLELNDKANLFKSHVYSEYGKKQVATDTSPDGFQKFYADTLKNFVKDNQLGLYEVQMLNKEFFTKTDGIRGGLEAQHVQSQLQKVGAEYKKKAINNIQGFFEDDGSADFYINAGAEISAYIKDMTLNGLGNETSQEYLLEALSSYVKNTDDIEGARKILSELPKHIQLGTGKFSDIKGLKDEFNILEDALLDREVANEDRIIKQKGVQESKDKRYIREQVDSSTFDIIEFKKTEEYNNLSNTNKKLVEDYYATGQGAFAVKDNQEVQNKIISYLKEGNYDEAEKYLLEVGKTQLREATFNTMRNNISYYEATGTNGELDNYSFKFYIKDIKTRVKAQNTGGIIIPPDIPDKFESFARRWLLENKDTYIGSNLEVAFEDVMRKKYNDTLLLLAGEKVAEIADLTKIGKKTETSTATTSNSKKTETYTPINIKDYAIMPTGLSRGQRVKFVRENDNAISQANFDALVKENKKQLQPKGKKKGTR